MCILNIKGLRFYGRLNDDHLKALFKVANVLNREDVRGIKGVYCIDGKIKKIDKDKEYLVASYVQFTKITKDGCVVLDMNYSNGDKEIIRIYKSPIITINGNLCYSEQQFVFNLLHEIGHHNDKFSINEAEKEIIAHLFALERICRIYDKLEYEVLSKYKYFEQAMEEFKDRGLLYK